MDIFAIGKLCAGAQVRLIRNAETSVRAGDPQPPIPHSPRRIVHLRQQQQRISELVARGLEVKRDPSLAHWLGGAKVEETADEAYVPNTGMRSCETPALATGHPDPARGAHHREPEGDDFRLYGPERAERKSRNGYWTTLQ